MINLTEKNLSKIVEQTFCPCCNRSIYFSVNETTEIVCRSCQSKYQIQYFKFIKQGLRSLESEESRQFLQNFNHDRLARQFSYLQCQDSTQQQKYLVLCPSVKFFAFDSIINLSELEYIRDDRIAIFFVVSDSKKPVLLLNCTNRQRLSFVSLYKPVTARLIEEGIFLGIVETPYWFQVLPITGFGIISLCILEYVSNISRLSLLIASSVFFLFLSSIFKQFIAWRERQKFRETNVKLIEEQEKLEKMRRLNLANLTSENN
jgi:hypothetical protein